MAYLGSWKIDDKLYFYCNTHDPDTGVATDADAVPSYRVYENETGAAILNGNMAKLDDANTVGFYSEELTLSAANGFEKGKQYVVYISATVDTDTGTMHHTWQMEAEVDANTVSDLTGVADAVLKRGVANVEATADMDSLGALILSKLHAAVSGLTLTIYKCDDTTVFDTKAITKSASADPITSVKDP